MYFMLKVKKHIHKYVRHKKYNHIVFNCIIKIQFQQRFKRSCHPTSRARNTEELQENAANVEIIHYGICRRKISNQQKQQQKLIANFIIFSKHQRINNLLYCSPLTGNNNVIFDSIIAYNPFIDK